MLHFTRQFFMYILSALTGGLEFYSHSHWPAAEGVCVRQTLKRNTLSAKESCQTWSLFLLAVSTTLLISNSAFLHSTAPLPPTSSLREVRLALLSRLVRSVSPSRHGNMSSAGEEHTCTLMQLLKHELRAPRRLRRLTSACTCINSGEECCAVQAKTCHAGQQQVQPNAN